MLNEMRLMGRVVHEPILRSVLRRIESERIAGHYSRAVVVSTASDDLRKLFGLRPYRGAGNLLKDSEAFARDLVLKHNRTIEDLMDATGVDPW